MTPEEAKELIPLLAVNELAEPKRSELLAFLEATPGAKAQYETLRETYLLLEEGFGEDADIEPQPTPLRWKTPLLRLAAILAIAGLFWGIMMPSLFKSEYYDRSMESAPAMSVTLSDNMANDAYSTGGTREAPAMEIMEETQPEFSERELYSVPPPSEPLAMPEREQLFASDDYIAITAVAPEPPTEEAVAERSAPAAIAPAGIAPATAAPPPSAPPPPPQPIEIPAITTTEVAIGDFQTSINGRQPDPATVGNGTLLVGGNGSAATIAVIDSGIDHSHAQLTVEAAPVEVVLGSDMPAPFGNVTLHAVAGEGDIGTTAEVGAPISINGGSTIDSLGKNENITIAGTLGRVVHGGEQGRAAPTPDLLPVLEPVDAPASVPASGPRSINNLSLGLVNGESAPVGQSVASVDAADKVVVRGAVVERQKQGGEALVERANIAEDMFKTVDFSDAKLRIDKTIGAEQSLSGGLRIDSDRDRRHSATVISGEDVAPSNQGLGKGPAGGGGGRVRDVGGTVISGRELLVTGIDESANGIDDRFVAGNLVDVNGVLTQGEQASKGGAKQIDTTTGAISLEGRAAHDEAGDAGLQAQLAPDAAATSEVAAIELKQDIFNYTISGAAPADNTVLTLDDSVAPAQSYYASPVVETDVDASVSLAYDAAVVNGAVAADGWTKLAGVYEEAVRVEPAFVAPPTPPSPKPKPTSRAKGKKMDVAKKAAEDKKLHAEANKLERESRRLYEGGQLENAEGKLAEAKEKLSRLDRGEPALIEQRARVAQQLADVQEAQQGEDADGFAEVPQSVSLYANTKPAEVVVDTKVRKKSLKDRVAGFFGIDDDEEEAAQVAQPIEATPQPQVMSDELRDEGIAVYTEEMADMMEDIPSADELQPLRDRALRRQERYRELLAKQQGRDVDDVEAPGPMLAAIVTPPASYVPEDDAPLPPAPPKPAPPVNPFVFTEKDAQSTFALEADTAAYTLSRRYIRKGYNPPPAVVRMEEFINAFDYQYPAQTAHTFTVHTDAAPAPFGKNLTLLKVGVRGKVLGRDGRKKAHLIFVVDASGSMARGDRMPLVQHSLRLLVDQLSPEDRVTLLTYGTRSHLLIEAMPAAHRDKIVQAIQLIECSNATNLLSGVQNGYALARRHYRAGEVNRIILCSDGVANLGPTDADALLSMVEENRGQGITFTSVGVGAGSYDDNMMEQLANRGDGNYVYIDSVAEAHRVFVDNFSATLQTIARDVKIQVEFNPAKVRRYRLIGYENRDIADKDFRNDKVDAGEIGSGQSATALYELELHADAESADFGTVYVRYKDVDSEAVTEFARRLAPEILRERTPQSDPRFYLAACVAEFAEILRESEHAGERDFQAMRQLLIQVANALPLDDKVQEFLKLVENAQGQPVFGK